MRLILVRYSLIAALLFSGGVVSTIAIRSILAQESVKPEKYALLIGVTTYKSGDMNSAELKYPEEDAKALGKLFSTSGYEVDYLLGSEAMRASILKKCNSLNQKGNSTGVIVIGLFGHGVEMDNVDYFCPWDTRTRVQTSSGGAVRDNSGREVIEPDPASLIKLADMLTGLKVSPAGGRVVLADCCRKVPNAARGRAAGFGSNCNIADLPDRTAVLFGCSSKQQAFEDAEWGHGAFTKCFLEESQRMAKLGKVKTGTLMDRLQETVPAIVSAKTDGRERQMPTPVSIGSIDLQLSEAQPQPLRDVLLDIAEQISISMQQNYQHKVGILPFISQTPGGEFVGADFGVLGHWCSAELENRLVSLGQGRFAVLDRRRLQDAVDSQKFDIAQLGSGESLKQLSNRVGGLPVLVEGVMHDRKGRKVDVQCKLVRTDTGEVIGTAEGTALLNVSEWAMLGHSVVVSAQDIRPEPPRPDHPSVPLAEQLIEALDQHANDSHPLLDPKFPLRLRLTVGGVERKGVFDGNDYLVPLRIGEDYEIEIENNTGHEILMRLLVDGLNTLPQSANSTGKGTIETAPRVDLDLAHHWSLDPKVSKVFRISGFVTATGAKGEVRKFHVARAEKSLAAQKQFTDQIGLITAAFYLPGSGNRSPIGTEGGVKERVYIAETGSTEVGSFVTSISIRYVDADEMKAAGK